MLTRLEKQFPLRYLESALRQTARDFCKASLHVTDAVTSGKTDASPISQLAFLISEISSSAEVACDKCGQIWKRRLAVVSEQAQFLRKLAPL
ncbi:hypothetical protein ACFX1W_006489 [Malus domestica]